MIGFIISASVLLLLTLMVLFWPFIQARIQLLIRRADRTQPSDVAATGLSSTQAQLNIEIYREELEKLDQNLRAQLISQAQYDTGRDEWSRRLIDEQADDAEHSSTSSLSTPLRAHPRAHSPQFMVAILSVFIMVSAFILYSALGSREALTEPSQKTQIDAAEVEKMVADLAQKLVADPANLKAWAMLARSYRVLRQPIKAEQAFERSATYLDQDAQLLAEYAEVIAINAQGNLMGKPTQILARALKLDPKNEMVLWLSGSAAFQMQDYARAQTHWEQLKVLLPSDSRDRAMIDEALIDARAKTGKK